MCVDTIDPPDLVDVINYLFRLKKDTIFDLFLLLGIDYLRLKTFAESKRFLYKAVNSWLNQEDQVSKKGKPSWTTLVKTLRHKHIGQNGIAQTIEEERLSGPGS